MAAAIDMIIEPRPRDIGGFEVRRVLPYAKRRTVGPFIFFDHVGPAAFPPGEGIDVRPHPHIGLATVTYLFEGRIRHRDSLGCVQDIEPGDVNWMTAGRGIVHSERSRDDDRASHQTLHGIQSWVALPQPDEEAEPSFHHHPGDTLPVIEAGGATLRLIAGTAFGKTSPVRTFSDMFYLDADMPARTSLRLPSEYEERALYVADGQIDLGGETLETGQMAVVTPDVAVTVKTHQNSRVMLLGGAPLDGPRLIWWNLVSSSQDRIDQAKRDWQDQKMGQVPGETEFIPLPD
ncbi:MAG: pirin family protein [Alphaproteobacteria bacterium]